MHAGNVTTPFGRRPAKLALVRMQLDIAATPQARTVNKWRVYRDVCEARTLLGVQDRALAVLNALLTFHPETELGEGGLVVFPSNAQLSNRAHGISGATLRRALAALVEAGLIERRDSPNGKRYAHRDRAGEVEQAFGFSLAPLVVRSEELALMAQKVAEEARRFRRAREALTICRRDVRKLITAAIEEGADGDWKATEAVYLGIVGQIPRSPRRLEVEAALEEMMLLRAEVVNKLEKQAKSKNMNASGSQNERHIQNSNTESATESEQLSEPEKPARCETKLQKQRLPQRTYPLEMVLRACPQIVDYGPGGEVTNWRDMQSAATVVRSVMGVSPSAYEDACQVMGNENAAVTVACILERHELISSAGGYLRELTARARRGEYSPGPALMALLKPDRSRQDSQRVGTEPVPQLRPLQTDGARSGR